MAIEASAILPSDSLEEFRVQFNNLVVDVEGVTGGNAFVSTIIFEGSTADANETTILATDPTSDNVITLPDATGTFITTGNSGDPATTTAAADADHVLVNDGGVLKKITRANLGIGGTAGAVAVDDLTAGDAAVSIATTAGNITIDAQGGNTDIIFKGTDGSSDITPMTLDMSDAGAILLTGGKIDLKNAGTASQILFYCESSNAHAQTLQSAPHSQAADNTLLLPDGGNGTLLSTVSTATVTNKTLTAPVINTATVGTSITPASDDGATLGSANLNWSDLFLADAAVIKLGDDQDVTLTHVHGTGILLNSTNVIQFNDASQNIGAPSNAILDINATDEIELNATLVDINANVEISGTAAITGIATFTDDIVIGNGKTIGSAGAATAITIASTGIVTFVDDILLKDNCTIGTATTAGAIAIAADGTVDLDTAGATVASAVIKTVGKESIWVPAAAMYPSTTNPCADLAQVETTALRPDLKVLDFATGADEFAQFTVAFPKSWNEGTVTFQPFWTVTGTNTGTVAWQLGGIAVSSDDTINVAFGSLIATTALAHSGTSNDLMVSVESGAVTIGGSPAVGDCCFFQINRDISADNQSGDARLVGIKLFFTTDAANDA